MNKIYNNLNIDNLDVSSLLNSNVSSIFMENLIKNLLKESENKKNE